jgi:hypothetical protein
MIKKRRRLAAGDVFKIKIKDNIYSYGQIIDKKHDLYVIYDIFSGEEEDLQEVIKRPIMFIVGCFDSKLKRGDWTILGNCEVSKDIVIPQFKTETLEGFEIINYKGEIIRKANKEEEKLLNYREDISPALLEDAIKARYGIEEWDEEFDSLIYRL